jgi:site-specific recombinase XerD
MNIDELLEYLTARNFSPNTIAACGSDLTQFAAFLRSSGTRVTTVTPKLIQTYINQLNTGIEGEKPATATVWRKLASISSYYQFLRHQSDGKIRNPVTLVLRPKRRRGNPQAIEDSQLDRLLGSITSPRDYALIMLFLSSGLRLSELHQLNRDSIAVGKKPQADGSVRVIGSGSVLGKGNKQRTFLTDADTLTALGAYLRTRHDTCPALFISNRGQCLSRREIQHVLANWCERAGLPKYHIHALRHSYARAC